MKLPGRGWLQFEVEKDKTGSIIWQTLIFDPIGILGLLYWYPLYPIHKLILKGTLNGIAKSIREQ
ncbi:MAG TPA: DUF2867 domain-containing protein [Nitrospinota bacterium]|nr:DUF2867 domain-containing protein [Nitrospinota bacterium]